MSFLDRLLVLLSFLVLSNCAFAESLCSRIVSLAPSITESVYLLGLSENLVGVTRFCHFPKEAQQKTSVGGFLDPNYESIAKLSPTLVIVLKEQAEQKRILEQLGYKVALVDHQSVAGIDDSLITIGKLCGKEQEAVTLNKATRRETQQIRQSIRLNYRPRVLVAIGGNAQDGKLANLFISGSDGFYSDLLALAGAKNIFERGTTSLPMLSQEGIIALNPDIIIQIGSETDGVRIAPQEILEAWAKLSMLRAVKDRRIYVFTQDFASIPSPRYPLLLREFVLAIHQGS